MPDGDCAAQAPVPVPSGARQVSVIYCFFDPVKEYLRKDIFLDIMPEGIDLHIYAEKKK